MSAELMRSYLDILNEQQVKHQVNAVLAGIKIPEDHRLDEGMLQKIASMVLGGAIAIGAMTSPQAADFFYYVDPATAQLQIVGDMDKVPADAKFVFSVDKASKTVNLVRDGKSVPVKTDPVEVRQMVQKCGGQGVTQDDPGVLTPKCGVTFR